MFAFSQAVRILRICSDPVTAQSRCNEIIEYLVRRGHGRRRTQLEVQRAIDAGRNPQQHIRNIDSGMYFIVQYHPGLPDIKGTLKKKFHILYTSELMGMVLLVLQLFRSPNQNTFLNNYVGPNFKSLRKKSSRVNHAKAIAASFVSVNCVTSTSNGRTFHCRNQGTNCNTKWAEYVIMCDVYCMQYVGQTNNIISHMNGHKSDYRRLLNGDFSKSDTSALYSHLKSHDVKIFMFHVLEILENEGIKYIKDIRQLETLTPRGLNVADSFHIQNRSSRKKRSGFFTFDRQIHIYIYT